MRRWSISVWPGSMKPADRRAGLWIGPVTIPDCGISQGQVDRFLHREGRKHSCRMLRAVEVTDTLVRAESWIELVRPQQDELGVAALLSEMPNRFRNHLRADSARITERDRQTLRRHVRLLGQPPPIRMSMYAWLRRLLDHALGEPLTPQALHDHVLKVGELTAASRRRPQHPTERSR